MKRSCRLMFEMSALVASSCAGLLSEQSKPETSAASDLPVWCGAAAFETSSSDMAYLEDDDPRVGVEYVTKLSCSPNARSFPKSETIVAARRRWSTQLAMSDADWADAIPYLERDTSQNLSPIPKFGKRLSELTPIDQFAAIRDGFQRPGNGESTELTDSFYMTDALADRLSELGRLAFLLGCASDEVSHESALRWAVCQDDANTLDIAKLSDEVRTDKAHDAATRMEVRVRFSGALPRLKKASAAFAQLLAKDAEYGRMLEVAASARKAWREQVGSDAQLMGLVQEMDSATFFGSREQRTGCEEKSQVALVKAVSSMDAKLFAGLSDVRDDPHGGFAYKAAPLLASNPSVYLAADAYSQCQHGTVLSDYLATALEDVAGSRGPRTAAISALVIEDFTFNDENAKPLEKRFPRTRPFSPSKRNLASGGGVVDTVKAAGAVAEVELKKELARRTDCVKARKTNHISQILSNGEVLFEEICEQTKVVSYDTSWGKFTVNSANVSWLEPGVLFSALIYAEPSEVIAVWRNKNADTPTIVLGATLK